MAIQDVSAKPLSDLVSLRGKVAAVTGAAGGMGLAIARRFAEAGCDVVIGDLDPEVIERAARGIEAEFGTRVIGLALDVAKEDSVIALANAAMQLRGRLDIWVNNAGIFPAVCDPVDFMTSTWDQVHDVNLRGVFFGAREAARRMTKQSPQGGVIINVSSVRGLVGARRLGAYTASKHGVVGLTKSLALDLGPRGIRVLGIAPATTVTPGLERRNQGASEAELAYIQAKDRNLVDTMPLGRKGVPDDIARVALFCASDLSMFMTGSELLVDGGQLA
jgi:NAD(P)-dependent dehydrogenase (short-subunit alcohol dehydrogenase family)